MAKFMVLYRASVSAREAMANTTEEQMKAGMGAWMAWAAKAGDAVLDLGAPLAPAGQAGQAPGPGGQEITGYSIMVAESAQELTALMNEHPHLHVPGNSIEVLEMLSMPGM